MGGCVVSLLVVAVGWLVGWLVDRWWYMYSSMVWVVCCFGKLTQWPSWSVGTSSSGIDRSFVHLLAFGRSFVSLHQTVKCGLFVSFVAVAFFRWFVRWFVGSLVRSLVGSFVRLCSFTDTVQNVVHHSENRVGVVVLIATHRTQLAGR